MAEKQSDNPQLKTFLEDIKAYKKAFKNWEERGKEIVKRYRDDDQSLPNDRSGKWGKNRYNVLWSNVQTMQPAIYARVPNAECERRWKDKDPLGRFAAEINERLGRFLAKDESFDQTMRAIRDDLLLPGRGVPWVRYIPQYGDAIGAGEDGQEIHRVVSEMVKAEHVRFTDFGHSLSCSWPEVNKVWRTAYMTKSQVEKRFGSEAAQKIKFNFSSLGSGDEDKKNQQESDSSKRAEIVELWNAEDKKVYWFNKDSKADFLDVKDDPTQFDDFFPCPRPIFASLTNDSLIPIADYCQYHYQATALDELYARRRAVIDAIKATGVFDAAHPELENYLRGNNDLKLFPIKDWARFAQAGALKGAVDMMDISPYVAALSVLNESIKEEEAALFQISGMSDIVRGYSNPNETATAQQIKGQFATMRLEDRQKEIQRVARDLIAKMTDLALAQFLPETIAEMVNLQEFSQEEQQAFPQALELLKNDKQRKFRLSIETDSTINIDEQQEKENRTKFLEAAGGFIQNAIEASQSAPEFMNTWMEMLQFGLRTFNAGRQLEYTIEQDIEGYKAKAAEAQANPQEPPPDPIMMKAQAEMQLGQMRAEQDQAKAQADMQLGQMKIEQEQAKAQSDLQLKQAEIQQNLTLEKYKIDQDIALKKYEIDLKFQLERESMAQAAQIDAIKATQEAISAVNEVGEQ